MSLEKINKMDDLKETYNKIAHDWHRDHQKDSWWVESVDRFISLLGSGKTVLDVGCGSGIATKYLVEHGLDVVGIDFSDNLIEIAKNFVPEARFEVLTFKEASNLNEIFDGLFMKAALLHVPKKEVEETLRGLVGLLKKSGYFYVAVKERKEGQAEEEELVENDIGYEYKRHFSYFTREELEKYFKDLKLSLVSFDSVLSGHTVWLQGIFKK